MPNLHKYPLRETLFDTLRQCTALIEALVKAKGQEVAIEVIFANSRYMNREDAEIAVTNALNGTTTDFLNMLDNDPNN